MKKDTEEFKREAVRLALSGGLTRDRAASDMRVFIPVFPPWRAKPEQGRALCGAWLRLIETDDGWRGRLVASDGVVLAMTEGPAPLIVDGGFPIAGVILPRAAVWALDEMLTLQNWGDGVSLRISADRITISCKADEEEAMGWFLLDAPLIDGVFPDHEGLLDGEEGGLRLTATDLEHAIAQVSAAQVLDPRDEIRLSLTPDVLTVALDGWSARASYALPVAFAGEPVEALLRTDHLRLAVIRGSGAAREIAIALRGAEEPARIYAQGEQMRKIFVLMPLRPAERQEEKSGDALKEAREKEGG